MTGDFGSKSIWPSLFDILQKTSQTEEDEKYCADLDRMVEIIEEERCSGTV